MAAIESTMLELGTKAPDFTLKNAVDGTEVSLSEYERAKGLLVIFMSNHCPFVKHVRQGIIDVTKEYQEKGVEPVAIMSNNVESHPDDHPDRMKEEAEKYGYPFPYLYDENQEVAKAYQAACTPDFFLFDKQFKLFYRGQLDDARPGNNKPVNGRDLRNALNRLLDGKQAPEVQKPSMGCNIKWKPGNEPDYFS